MCEKNNIRCQANVNLSLSSTCPYLLQSMKKCELPISVTKLPRTSVRKSLVTSWSMKKCCRYANLWVRILHLYTVGPLPTPNSGAPRCLVYLSLINFNFCPETSTFNFRTLFTCCDNHWLLSTELWLAVTSRSGHIRPNLQITPLPHPHSPISSSVD